MFLLRYSMLEHFDLLRATNRAAFVKALEQEVSSKSAGAPRARGEKETRSSVFAARDCTVLYCSRGMELCSRV